MSNSTPATATQKSIARTTQKSVTCFLQHQDHYLFIHRTAETTVDAGLVNGIGGKLEPGEDFLSCAVREVAEETGYQVAPDQCHLRAIVTLEGGYPQDWVMCFFVIPVETRDVPLGMRNAEGELLWLHQDHVLDAGYELVDDLNYCWPDITAGKELLYIALEANDQEKISKYQVQKVPILQHNTPK